MEGKECIDRWYYLETAAILVFECFLSRRKSLQHGDHPDVRARHTFVAHSENITMTNLDMNATSSSQWSTVNTDGFDSWNSKNIVIKNWVVTCGDVGAGPWYIRSST